MFMMHQPVPKFVWYITKNVDDERWHFVRIEGDSRCWSKNVERGRYWYGLPAAQAYKEDYFASDDVEIGGRVMII